MKVEAVDVYDKNKNKTRKIINRYSGSLEIDEYALAVKAIIMNSNYEFLISRRSLSKRLDPGKWEINGGACIAGETSLQGIIREIKEELGIDLKNVKGILFKEYCQHPYFYDIWLFKLDVDINKLNFLDSEVIDAKWVNIEQIICMEKNNLLINYENLNCNDYKEVIKKIKQW